ncbi:phospholipase D-like domain-containing protein [Echinicola salinicaeni]|uniref:phospholipase D-like domain-containing protein n=1 Tax=Echinicola salinicaeni TaxID=2762757 RepID=UPI00164839A3|nr:phospholipase D-like domain-containing protein [Echinicola salinicaeni]
MRNASLLIHINIYKIYDNKITDELIYTHQKKFLTGNYNWTRSAAEYNYENILLLEDIHTVRSFQKEFERLWREL